MDLKRRVIHHLTEKYGSCFLEFEKCREIYEDLLAENRQIIKELDASNKDSEIFSTINQTTQILNEGENLIKECKVLLGEVETSLSEIDTVRKNVQKRFDKLNSLQATLQYFRVLEKIEILCGQMEREFRKKNDEQCATIYANLCEISRNLIGFNGKHLVKYLSAVLRFWHNNLKDKLSKDYNDVLKAIKWPFVTTNFSSDLPSSANIRKMQVIAEYLLQIQLPSECADPSVGLGVLSDFPPLSLPVLLLVQPLEKRFIYHFYGNRKTNDVEKPEWYFTQILTWIRDHTDFVVKWIQPVVDSLGLHHIDARIEFTRGLVQLTVEKLNKTLPLYQFADHIYAHTIDEALGFDKELRETYSYPATQPGILVVLTQAQVFMKWLTMEKKFAAEKMDAIFADSNEAFEPVVSDSEDMKITTCADAFTTLLQTITERYEALPQPGHRLQFLELQLELLDDFRVRLLQLVNVETTTNIIDSHIPMIANTVYFIENILIDWGSMLHFLSLYYYKSQLMDTKTNWKNNTNDDFDNSYESETVFENTLALYRHLRQDLLQNLTDFVMFEVTMSMKSYRRENWSNMKLEEDWRSLSLTPTACPVFEILAKHLHFLQKKLVNKLFTVIWRSIAQQLDDYLLENLVLDNRFNKCGAFQLKYDIYRNLLPLFAQFSDRPENYFSQVIESCNLLNISRGSAMLLRQTLMMLEGATGVEDTRGRALNEVGVASLTPMMAVKILNQRTDITVNRLIVD